MNLAFNLRPNAWKPGGVDPEWALNKWRVRSAGCGIIFAKGGAPQPQSLADQFTGTLGAMKTAAPTQLALESEFLPQYQNLDLNTLQSFLQGGVNAPGLLSLIGQSVPALDRLTAGSANRLNAGAVRGATRLAPAALNLADAANPNATPLLDTLNNSALEQLKVGSNLTPAQLAQFRQYVRGAQAARGMGNGPSDVLGETLGEQNFGQQLLGQRQQFASGVAGLNQSATQQRLNWLASWLGNRGSSVPAATNLAGGGLSQQKGFGPALFDPMNQYASSYYSNQLQAQMNASNQSANNQSALLGGSAQLLGTIAMAAALA